MPSPTSDTSSSTKTPEPVRPVGGATVKDSPLTLAWSEVPDATEYRVQIARETDFESLFLDTIVEANEPSVTVQDGAPLDGSTCYWRVRVEAPNESTDWSPVAHFTGPTEKPATDSEPGDAPQPMQPTDRAPVDGRAAVFTWEPTPRAILYELQVAPAPDFTTPVAGLSLDPATSLTLYSALPNDGSLLHWRIRAQRPNDTFTPWSDPAQLTAATDEAVRHHESTQTPHEEDLAKRHRIEAMMHSDPKDASEPVKTARTSRTETLIWAGVTVISFVITILLIAQALP